jgi:osomolarity two-component system sensor histidine kinase TcsA
MDYSIIDLNPIPTIVLDQSLYVQRISKSFLIETTIPLEACQRIDFLVLLKNRGLLRDDCAGQLRWALDTAMGTKTMQRVHQISIGTYHGSIRVVPIFQDSALLCFVLEWHKVTTPLREDYLEMEGLNNGLSTNEAFRILVETVKDYAIFLLDRNGYVVTWNVGAELNKQYKREEIIGKHFSIFYSDEDLKENKPQLELDACLREGRVEDEGWRYVDAFFRTNVLC